MSSTLLEYGGDSVFKNSNITLDPINSFNNLEAGHGIIHESKAGL